MFKKACCVAVIALAVAGCGSTSTLNQKATDVRLSPNAPAKNCTYKGKVSASSNSNWGADKNLEEDAMNQMRNQAANMGANYVQLTPNKGSALNFEANGQQTPVTDSGNAYHCPNLD